MCIFVYRLLYFKKERERESAVNTTAVNVQYLKYKLSKKKIFQNRDAQIFVLPQLKKQSTETAMRRVFQSMLSSLSLLYHSVLVSHL